MMKFEDIKEDEKYRCKKNTVLVVGKDPSGLLICRTVYKNGCTSGQYALSPYQLSPLDDAVNHPSHYTQGGIECIDALTAATTGLDGIEAVCTANAIKYLWRWKHKNGVEDLKKAQFYINYLIGRLEKEEGDDKRDE